MSVASFVQQFLPQAQAVSASTGLPVDYVLGQSGLESGWGTSNAATSGNNYFGISPGGTLASYPDATAGFNAYAGLINSPRYAGVSGVASSGGSALDIGNYLNGQGYSTTPDYGSRVANATAAVDAVLGPGQGGVVTPGSTDAPGAGAASQGGCGLNPACWLGALGTFLGGYATRAALILLAIILMLGAVYLFASRTQAVASPAPA